MPEQTAHSAPNRRMLRRILALMAIFGVAAFVLLILRLYRLQITDHEYYEELAIGQQLRALRWKTSSSVRRRSTRTARTGR